MGAEFHSGDIVDFLWLDGAKTKEEQNNRNTLNAVQPFKLVVLRAIDENDYLVAVCKARKRRTQLTLKTNTAPLYIRPLSFYQIDSDCLHSCHEITFQENSRWIVDRIYETHNRLVEQRKQEKVVTLKEKKRNKAIIPRKRKSANEKNEEQQKRRRLKKRFNRAMNTQENKCIGQYEIAVMNNDKGTMREIVKKAGHFLEEKGDRKGYHTKNGKILYSHFNPHPCSGGRFTPK